MEGDGGIGYPQYNMANSKPSQALLVIDDRLYQVVTGYEELSGAPNCHYKLRKGFEKCTNCAYKDACYFIASAYEGGEFKRSNPNSPQFRSLVEIKDE